MSKLLRTARILSLLSVPIIVLFVLNRSGVHSWDGGRVILPLTIACLAATPSLIIFLAMRERND